MTDRTFRKIHRALNARVSHQCCMTYYAFSVGGSGDAHGRATGRNIDKRATWPIAFALLLRCAPLEPLGPVEVIISLCEPKAVFDLADAPSPNPAAPPAAEVILRAVDIREPARLRHSPAYASSASSGAFCPLLCKLMGNSSSCPTENDTSALFDQSSMTCTRACESKVSTFYGVDRSWIIMRWVQESAQWNATELSETLASRVKLRYLFLQSVRAL